MRGIFRLLLPILLLVLALPSFAQSPAVQITPTNDTGVAQVGSAAVPMGSVNLVNGNLSLALPLITLPGRGGASFPLMLQYDSKLWAPHVSFPIPEDAQINWDYEKQAYPVGLGWHLNVPVINNGGLVQDDNGNNWGLGYFVLTMPDGSKHSIAGAASGLDSEDGDALHLEAGYIPDANHGFSGIAQDITVTTNDGTRIHFPSDGATADKITDRNGNYVTISDTSITDSAGHVITLVNGSDGYTAVKYTDSNGQEQTITLNYSQTLLFSTDSSSSQYTGTRPYQYPLQSNNVCYSSCYSHVWVSQPILNTTWGMLSSVVMPDGDTYSFTYNGYGELTKIVYPGGGYARYDFSPFTHGEAYWEAAGGITADFREVTEQYLCPQGTCSSSQEQKTLYSPDLNDLPNTDQGANEQVTVTDPMGNVSWHNFWHSTGSESAAESVHSPPQEIEAKYYDGPNTLLKRVVTDYPEYNGLTIPFPTKVTTSLCTTGGNALSTITRLTYDTPILHFMGPFWGQYTYEQPTYAAQPVNSVIERDVYDFVTSTCDSGTPSQGTLLRKDTATFLSSDSHYGPASLAHTPAFPLTQKTYADATSNSPIAQTTFEYDVYSGPNHAALVSSGASQLVTAPGGPYRGNVTSVTKMKDSSSTLTSYSQYYDTGSLHIGIDPNGNQTTYSYGSDFLYPTSAKNALNQTDGYTYYGSTGQLHTHTDPNHQTTTYIYDGSLRLSSMTLPPDPNNGNASGGINFNHVSPTLVKQSTIQNASVSVEKDYLFDGIGRQIETQLMDSDHHTCSNGVIHTKTTYDDDGRVWKTSNPFCSTGDSTYGETATVYDGLGRNHIVTQSDGTSTLQWRYSGDITTFTDEANNQWQRTSDALGRLTKVIEPGSLATTYQYNALGDLTCADQWETGPIGQPCTSSRPRAFIYDSLSRLTSATNPETGTIGYAYLLSGGGFCAGDVSLPCSKTDALGITTNYTYDALNRITSKNYLHDPNATPSTCFLYDTNGSNTPINAIGRLTAEWTQTGTCQGNATSLPASGFVTAKVVTSYDAMGRLLTQQTCVLTNCTQNSYHPQSFSHDLAGNLTSFSDGWGLQSFTQSYDAAGRLQFLTSSWSDPTHPPTLYGVQNYGPIGVLNATMGNHLTITKAYDSRERITKLTVQGVH